MLSWSTPSLSDPPSVPSEMDVENVPLGGGWKAAILEFSHLELCNLHGPAIQPEAVPGCPRAHGGPLASNLHHAQSYRVAIPDPNSHHAARPESAEPKSLGRQAIGIEPCKLMGSKAGIFPALPCTQPNPRSKLNWCFAMQRARVPALPVQRHQRLVSIPTPAADKPGRPVVVAQAASSDVDPLERWEPRDT